MKQSVVFHNCLIQAPDGENLSRCGLKKIKWYVSQGLADVVDHNPMTIRLRFEPRGREGVHDPLLMEGKPNFCVVCGSTEGLSRHHIIPYCFIRHMRIEYKMDIIRDIFLLCDKCHCLYETQAEIKKKKMAEARNIPVGGIHKDNMREVKHASGAAKTLLKYAELIPEHRKEYLLQIVRQFLGKENITEKDLEQLRDYRADNRNGFVSFGSIIAKEVKDYNVFAKEWREHFIETMQPKYMPPQWKVDRKTEHVWIPKRMLHLVEPS